MRTKLRERINVQKMTRFAVVLNTLQILAMGGVFIYVLLHDVAFLSRGAELVLLGFCLLIVIWGAAIDIRDALVARKIAEQTRMIEEAYAQLEELNGTLRRQRHDFMNHLQVVFSLTELGGVWRGDAVHRARLWGHPARRTGAAHLHPRGQRAHRRETL